MKRTVDVGEIVLYRLTEKDTESGRTEIRPAVVVRVNTETSINLSVFTDGPNDGAQSIQFPLAHKKAPIPLCMPVWAGSVEYSREPACAEGSWCFREDLQGEDLDD